MSELLTPEEIPSYEEFVAKYGTRPKDIIYNMVVKLARDYYKAQHTKDLKRFWEALEQSRKGEPPDLSEEAFELFSAIENNGIAKAAKQIAPPMKKAGLITDSEHKLEEVCAYCPNKPDGAMLVMGNTMAHAPCVVQKLNELLDPDWDIGRQPSKIVDFVLKHLDSPEKKRAVFTTGILFREKGNS